MVNIPFVPVLVAHFSWVDGHKYKLEEGEPHEDRRRSFRAARLVGDSTRFLIASFPNSRGGQKALKSLLEEWQERGVEVGGSRLVRTFEQASLHSRASRRYAWLGYSDNHVKDGKVLLFREDEQWSSSSLLGAFGNVYEVFLNSGYGKYAARVGLSFSATVDVLDVSSVMSLCLIGWPY